jgi:ethanolamine utilization protein EutA
VDLSSRYLVVSRETWYESPVSLTPYESETLIDARALGEIVDDAYNVAKIHPNEIDTGVVILTGEALRRSNSERIGQILSEKCGELVCVAAGHHMEAMLAAHGSGAVESSHDNHERTLNVDIGGGTTKLSIIDNGIVQVTAALHIGGRLLAVDEDGVLVRMEPAGKSHAKRAGLTLAIGDKVSSDDFMRIARSMTDDLVHALTDEIPSGHTKKLYLTDPIDQFVNIDSIVFSGGVSEFIYEREPRDFGDLGPYLGHAIRDSIAEGKLNWRVDKESQGIRATVLGASEYSTQLSGNTGFISDPATLLPRRNLQVVHTEFEFTEIFDANVLATEIQKTMQNFDLVGADVDLVHSFHWEGHPDYKRVRALADAIYTGLAERIQRGKPLFIILDADIALNLGRTLKEDLKISSPIMVIDGVALWNFDYIDLGRMREPSNTVPVMIKSLVFKDVSGDNQRFERLQFEEDK